jgi:glyoxylase-like metal-dependent hydrolase (beta-lactamase superfamily II)
MEIAPDVHAVSLRGANGFLLTDAGLSLIDAGLAGSKPVFERYLATIGREITELDRIVCTHGHPDHVGGAREIADAAGAEIYIHPTDLEGVGLTVRQALVSPQGESLRGRLLQAMTPHPGEAVALHDGDVLPVLGGLEVIHTPGHTPGSVCLFARGPRILFTGDVLQVRRGNLAFASPIFSHDHAQARASVQRLARLEVDMIVFSHFQPMRDGASDALADLARQAAVRT